MGSIARSGRNLSQTGTGIGFRSESSQIAGGIAQNDSRPLLSQAGIARTNEYLVSHAVTESPERSMLRFSVAGVAETSDSLGPLNSGESSYDGTLSFGRAAIFEVHLQARRRISPHPETAVRLAAAAASSCRTSSNPAVPSCPASGRRNSNNVHTARSTSAYRPRRLFQRESRQAAGTQRRGGGCEHIVEHAEVVQRVCRDDQS